MEASNLDIKLFKSVVPGKNFVTPEILMFLKIEQFIVEISQGEFMDQILYGFTVVQLTSDGEALRRDDLSECLRDQAEIEQKKESLKNYVENFIKKWLKNEG